MKHLSSFAVLVVLCFTFAVQADLLYIHDGNGNLGTVDNETGALTYLGNAGIQFTDIAFNSDGDLFGISFNSIYAIADDFNSVTNIGNHGIAGGNALVFGNDGTLYAAGSSLDLFTVDLTTGGATSIGTIGYRSAGDLAFNSGNLYLASTSNELVLIDQSNYSGTAIGAFGYSNVYGLATADDGVLYGVSGQNVFSINTATGEGTAVTTYSGLGASWGSSFFEEANQPVDPVDPTQDVPEPSTMILLGLCLSSLFFIRKNKIIHSSF